MFSKFFDWFGFNVQMVKQYAGREVIAAFDPCLLKKEWQVNL
jgi:hypothetical protein